MKASAVSKKSSRPSAGNSSSISNSLWRRSMPSEPSSDSVSRRPIWLRISRISGLVRLMSDGGTTRYSDTGCSAAIRSAMRQSQRDVTTATVGSRYNPRKDIAVESTPERSLSALLRTSRAAEATTGCGVSPKCFVVIIRCRASSNGHAGSDRKLATPRSVLSSPA